MNDKKRKRLFFIAIGLIVLLGGGFAFMRSRSGSSMSYKKLPVKRGTLSVTILTTGTVQPENRLEIKPPIAGRMESILVKEGQTVRKGQIMAWMSSTERAAMLDSARALGAEEQKKWEELYRPTPVIAPIHGMIISQNVEPGQTFTSTDSILVMSDRLTVKAQVDETDIAQVKLKQRAEIILDAYSAEKIPAKVDQIAFEAKTVNNVTTYLVDVLPDETPEFMRAGMTANVTFIANTHEDTLWIPTDAILSKEDSNQVLVQSSKDPAQEKPETREIKIGISDGKRTEVVQGLAESEIILIPQINRDPNKKKGPNASPFSPMGGGGGRGH